ncbi:MAG: cell division protein FtsL [Betaproteobacteria bacterium]|nr:cell division protein FtsL [Betaproteobacteria bacterium]
MSPDRRPEGEHRSAQREGTLLSVVLLFVLVACALSLVTSRHQARRLFVELERAQTDARAFETEYGQLQLEQSTWGMPARVEKIAREQLKMLLPTPARTEVVTMRARAQAPR